MSRRKQAKPRPVKIQPNPDDDEERCRMEAMGCSDDSEEDDPIVEAADHSPYCASTSEMLLDEANWPKRRREMPPTDGEVAMAPSIEAVKSGGDSSTALAANSALSAPYTCSFCQRSFPRLSLLKKHEQAHSDEMPFRCDFCLRHFKHKRSRDRHVKLHTGDKKYRCEHCEAAFSRSDHLKIHIKTHDTRKPFQCNVCQRGYSTAAALTSHMLNHRRESGSRCGSLCSSTSSPVSVTSSITSVSSSVSSNASTPCPSITPSLPSPVSPSPPTPLPCTPTAPGSKVGQTVNNSPAKASGPTRLHPPPPTPEPSPKPTHVSCCIDCHAEFRTPHEFQAHMATHDSKKSSAREHDMEVDRPVSSEMTKLPNGQQQQPQPQPQQQNPSDNSIVMACPYCAKESFSSLEALSLHVQALHGPLPHHLYDDGPKQALELSGLLYACQLCSLRFASLPALQQHTLSAHSLADVLRLYCQPQLTAPTPTVATAAVASENSIGGEPQSVPTDLSCRRKRTLSESESEVLKSDGRDERTEEIDVVGLPTHPRYCCPHCSADFAVSDADQFELHVAMHLVSTSTEYGCQSCFKSFSKPDELQKHLLDIHAHHLYRCALCKEMFDSKVSIQVHFAVKHSNECKLYRCTACTSVFRTEADFSAHVKSSHISRIFPQPVAALRCPLCPESFPVEFLLERHLQLVHTSSKSPCTEPIASAVVTTIRCDICDEEVVDSVQLQTHRKERHHLGALPEERLPESINIPTVLNLSLHCAYCGETCKSRLDLESHMKSHHPSNALFSGRLKCNICDDVFPSAVVLAEHKLTHCKVLGASQCTACRSDIKSEEQFYSHLQQHGHQSPPFPCIVCRQTLNLTLEVGLHAKFHAKSASEPLYPCCFCHKQYESQNLIANGMAPGGLQTYVCKDCLQTSHQQLILHSSTFRLQPPLQPTLTAQPQPRSFQCIKCQQIFPTEAEIQAHVATHLMTEGSVHPCRLCQVQFDTPFKLQTHLIEHTFAGCPGFTCYLCGSVFTAAANLQRHMFDHGLATRPYDCSRCHLRFFFRAELENHLFSHQERQVDQAVSERREENGRPMASELSEDVSTDSSHAETDTSDATEAEKVDELEEDDDDEEEEEMLSSTSSSESTEISLSDAKKAANAVPDEISDQSDRSGSNQYRCDRCDKSFPCLSNLQGHIRIHTQSTRFTCPTCKKEFALSRNLHIHMRSHSGEKPYECPVCHKRFARKENRKAHLKLHSGVKPFTCGICSKSFSRKCHLRTHRLLHQRLTDQVAVAN